MTGKLDFKRAYHDLYQPGKEPMLIDVPPIVFFLVDGHGAPKGEEYQAALQALYTMTFTIKMSKHGPWQPEGYQDYVLPPLEGFWHSEGGSLDFTASKESWHWTSCIRQPEFVTEGVCRRAMEECRRKKPEVDVSRLRREVVTEGLCVQVMHVGSYDTETASMDKLHRYAEDHGLKDCTGLTRRHHEIYLGDPRKTVPERLKTVLRMPVERAK